MSKIIESLQNLSVENDKKSNKQVNGKTCRKKELILSMEESVSSEENYILSVCGTQSESEFRIGAALSDYSCVVYSVGQFLNRILTLNQSQAPVVGIKFSSTSRNILYIATNDGHITACDMRAKGKVVAEFEDSTEGGKTKPLASFDISSDEKLIAGGTEHIGGDAFILFWDIRHTNSKIKSKNNLLGGYWESHMDDITYLTFHPTKRDVLASGSTDGLINVFDLTQSSEDLALTYSLNTESSVDRIGWLTDQSLWCTTHTHALQLWNCEDASAYATFERDNLSLSQNDDSDSCYLVRVHNTSVFGQPFLLAGCSTLKGEKLRCLSITNNQLETCYEIVGNKQIVRDSWLHEKSGRLVTVGEGGIINIWLQAELTPTEQNLNHELLTKIGTGKDRDRHHRIKPY
ncbi:WD repeat-containing protein 89 [Pseudomyrmex gracilis]|uniref:WD repeat-containing protein 89 n=1 Tax=Pseudomyrmex gracilis TaxID=219809 RepID=UPI0009951225|nr:WD repeat-containing protein 89 [Pseudomyrmex gracilis]